MRLSGVKRDDSVCAFCEFVQLLSALVSSERRKTTAAFSCKQGKKNNKTTGISGVLDAKMAAVSVLCRLRHIPGVFELRNEKCERLQTSLDLAENVSPEGRSQICK